MEDKSVNTVIADRILARRIVSGSPEVGGDRIFHDCHVARHPVEYGGIHFAVCNAWGIAFYLFLDCIGTGTRASAIAGVGVISLGTVAGNGITGQLAYIFQDIVTVERQRVVMSNVIHRDLDGSTSLAVGRR